MLQMYKIKSLGKVPQDGNPNSKHQPRKLRVCHGELWERLRGEDILGDPMPYISQFFKNISEANKLLNSDLHDDADSNSDLLVSMELRIGLCCHRASCPMAHLPFLLSLRDLMCHV